MKLESYVSMAGVGLVIILMILAVHVEAQESVTLGGRTGADRLRRIRASMKWLME